MIPVAVAAGSRRRTPSISSYRHYLVRWPTNHTDFASISMLGMYETKGGPNVAVSSEYAAVSQHSTFGSFVASRTYDESGFNHSVSANANEDWWTAIDFGAGNEKAVGRIALKPYTGEISRMPQTDFTLEGSNLASPNGDTPGDWTVIATFTPGTWVEAFPQTFDVAGVVTEADWGRRWAIRYPSVHTDYAGVQELEFRGSIGGADLTNSAGGSAFGSLQNSTQVPANAFDENTTTNTASWVSQSNVNTTERRRELGMCYVGWDFGVGNPQELAEFRMMIQRGLVSRGPQTDFDILKGGVDILDMEVVNTLSPSTPWVDGVWQTFLTS